MSKKYACFRCNKMVRNRDYKKYVDSKDIIEWLCPKCYEKAVNMTIDETNQQMEEANKEMDRAGQESIEEIDEAIEKIKDVQE